LISQHAGVKKVGGPPRGISEKRDSQSNGDRGKVMIKLSDKIKNKRGLMLEGVGLEGFGFGEKTTDLGKKKKSTEWQRRWVNSFGGWAEGGKFESPNFRDLETVAKVEEKKSR